MLLKTLFVLLTLDKKMIITDGVLTIIYIDRLPTYSNKKSKETYEKVKQIKSRFGHYLHDILPDGHS